MEQSTRGRFGRFGPHDGHGGRSYGGAACGRAAYGGEADEYRALPTGGGRAAGGPTAERLQRGCREAAKALIEGLIEGSNPSSVTCHWQAGDSM